MLILAFDTTQSGISLALFSKQKLLAKKTISESGKQSEILIVEIEKILQENGIWYQDLALIASTNGFGSFTGVRVGLVAARIMKMATKIPLILTNSCEVIAYKYRKQIGKILVVNDASMNEFFVAEFIAENNKITQQSEAFLVKMEELREILPQQKYFLCGSGKESAAEILKCKVNDEKDEVDAELIGLLAYEKFLAGEVSTSLDPLYLRMPKIEKRKK